MPKGDDKEKTQWVFRRPALIELTHNWGTENDDSFTGYHSGNEEPKGFGHIGISVPDVYAACERFAKYDVEFVKQPDGGSMKVLPTKRQWLASKTPYFDKVQFYSCGFVEVSLCC